MQVPYPVISFVTRDVFANAVSYSHMESATDHNRMDVVAKVRESVGEKRVHAVQDGQGP